ncbi:YfhO family protein [Vagococcus intermedius]|uniref:YfhO family protein n=1 Tax=Vagococcus intermedius TaxID=2991418 RepID=A0AAF0I9U1_9ENTE|nr:YfhO family protein [Vagococcus intermedius]WEG73757.1 YfhO family protein [Vagococcus intermedius]WEG75842.1 YfhO family protein [Vagococcus intermedius]
MITRLKQAVTPTFMYGLMAFLLPISIMMITYASLGIYWGSERSILASDSYAQFSNFHASFNNMLHGKQSLFYTWNSSLGLNYYALISYYLGGIFTPLVFFFDNTNIPDALYLLTLLKIGSASLAFWYYALKRFNIQPLLQVGLAISYSLMSFITAHSELIMWLDAFIYLPLIILGIDRLLAKQSPVLLFVSYFLLFVSNFYFGFIIGVYSFLYYAIQVISTWQETKKTISHYMITSLLAGGASMVMILPTILDLRSNGEELNELTNLKTAATGFWDIVIKNMVGVYDTTKYDSIPFIYIGLLPLLFCLFFFLSTKVDKKQKLAFLILFGVISLSFYFEPLNLFWHGFHSPNMFLFRYSFTFSFTIIMLAGKSLVIFTKEETPKLLLSGLILNLAFILAYTIHPFDHYTYLTSQHLVMTLLFLGLYLFSLIFFQIFPTKPEQKKWISIPKSLAIMLLLTIIAEATVNTHGTLNGIKDDWHYASRSLYSDTHPDYQKIIEQTYTTKSNEFYRIETLDPISANDSINYGYSGISQFSSIRNRPSSSLLNTLGFRSRGTNLNIRYQNNTLLMDSLFGITYNHSQQPITKFGFEKSSQNNSYQMWHNRYALSLGILTDSNLFQTDLPKNDNLTAQQNLTNQLSQRDDHFYEFTLPTLSATTNSLVTTDSGKTTFKAKSVDKPQVITWTLTVPAHKQVYFSLFPTDLYQLKNASVELTINGNTRQTPLKTTGQYLDLGFYPKQTPLTFSVSFSGADQITVIQPPVVLLDTDTYQKAFTALAKKQVPFQVKGRSATADIHAKEDQLLFTTIPYDKGWHAYLDGQKIPIKAYQKALITVKVPKGRHVLTFKFLPAGFKLGLALLFLCSSLFYWYQRKFKQKRRSL